jgi:LmbE family N-acetylglucosaminyl deacetylase
MAGGTFAKYISEGYQGIYVCALNNLAGCGIESVGGGTNPPAGVPGPLFSIADSPRSYPVDALETMQIRREEMIRAAAVFNAVPIFLDFRQGYFWQGRKRCYLGSDEYHRFQPPGTQVVSLAEIEPGYVDSLVDLLRKYSPEIVIMHTLGGEKHDHGNSAYLMYLAFKRAMEKDIAVGELWMRTKGWLLDDEAILEGLGKAVVRINVKDYIDTKYEALNKHVSQTGIPRKQTLPEEETEVFIRVLDNTRED